MFGSLIIGIWDLFVIWCLGFGILVSGFWIADLKARSQYSVFFAFLTPDTWNPEIWCLGFVILKLGTRPQGGSPKDNCEFSQRSFEFSAIIKIPQFGPPETLSLRSMVGPAVVLLSQTRGDLFSMVHHLLDVLVFFLKTLLQGTVFLPQLWNLWFGKKTTDSCIEKCCSRPDNSSKSQTYPQVKAWIFHQILLSSLKTLDHGL